MSSSVTLSIATNSTIAASKLFGWIVTGSPTLLAESIHSVADVSNQVLLKVGEVKARGARDRQYPFGPGQKRFFWALVSAISVFFVGCGLTGYHGVVSLLHPVAVKPFTALTVGLLGFALVLELSTFWVALREIGGWKGLARNRSNTTVLAVLAEDGVAVIGLLLTLLVAAVSALAGPQPLFDAAVAIAVAAMLGAMALWLARLNGRLLVDVADRELDETVQAFLAREGVPAEATSVILDADRAAVFVRVQGEVEDARWHTLGEAIKAHCRERGGRAVEVAYWKFPAGPAE